MQLDFKEIPTKESKMKYIFLFMRPTQKYHGNFLTWYISDVRYCEKNYITTCVS